MFHLGRTNMGLQLFDRTCSSLLCSSSSAAKGLLPLVWTETCSYRACIEAFSNTDRIKDQSRMIERDLREIGDARGPVLAMFFASYLAVNDVLARRYEDAVHKILYQLENIPLVENVYYVWLNQYLAYSYFFLGRQDEAFSVLLKCLDVCNQHAIYRRKRQIELTICMMLKGQLCEDLLGRFIRQGMA
jgi:hypothetical protein